MVKTAFLLVFLSECTKIVSPFASDVAPQAQVSQGIPQRELVFSVFIAEKIAVR